MKTNDLFKLSTRIFTARKGRTALTILGMGIGFGAILFLVSLGYGLQDALLKNITSTGALMSLDVTANDQEEKLLTSEAARDMENISGVAGVETSYNFNAQLKLGETGSDSRAIVASPGYVELEGLKFLAGQALDKDNPKEILVSAAIGKVFEIEPQDLIGKTVSFAVLPTSTGGSKIEMDGYTIAGVSEGEETIFYTLIEEIAVPADATYTKVKVRCESSESIAQIKDSISQMGFSVSSLSETVNEVNRLFRVVNFILGLFGIITLAVSAIGMFNTMTVALLERTTEIGIMRSIGASRTDIMLMFIIESTLMGFCGGIAGLILGIASGQSVNTLVNAVAKYMGGKPLDLFSYPFWFLGFVLLFSIIIGFATGIGPAKRASSLDPLDALSSR